MPGRKNLSCPAAIRAAVGTIWEMSKLGGLNIKECPQPRKTLRGKMVFAGEAGSRPRPLLGKADDTGEETGRCLHRGDVYRLLEGALPLPHRYYRLMRPSYRLSPPSPSASPGESWPVATSSGCRWDLPDVITVNLSPDAWSVYHRAQGLWTRIIKGRPFWGRL
jgi:hypothetical protein